MLEPSGVSTRRLLALGVLGVLVAGCGGAANHAASSTASTVPTNSPSFAITARSGFESSFRESLLQDVRALDGIERAVGGVNGEADVVKDGHVIDFGGAPHLAFSVGPAESAILRIVAGRWPRHGEVVVDNWTARKKQIQVGSKVTLVSGRRRLAARVSGLVKVRQVSTIGGATIAGLELRDAQRLLTKEGRLDLIRVYAKSGIDPTQLVAQIRRILPRGTTVRRAR